MRDFIIALVAQKSLVTKTADNLDAALRWMSRAAKKGAELVVFPELNISGHAGHPAMIADAEEVPGGPACRAVMQRASELGVYTCCGISEFERGVQYNTQFVVGPEGFLGKQRKVHLSGDEYFYFRGGREIPVIETPLGRLGVVICFDNSFPEMSRVLAVKGAEVILAVHAARFGRMPRDVKGRRERVRRHKNSWLRTHSARAQDNGLYVALTNAVGSSVEGIRGLGKVEANHAGGCVLVDPDGETAAESKSRDIREELVIARVEAAKVTERRDAKCFNLRVRKPECFRALCEPGA